MALVDLSPDARRHGPMPHSEKDWCDKDGAVALAERIKEYWLERGKHVEIQLRANGFIPAMRSTRVDVRSNMLNGQPIPLPASQRSAA